jgi:CDGSH-type Zn-finger protein
MFVPAVNVPSFGKGVESLKSYRVGSGRPGMRKVVAARSLRSNLLNGDRKHEPKETKELAQGDKFPACRCWQSNKFPMCDGSHAKYNKETGDNVGPLVVAVSSGAAGL